MNDTTTHAGPGGTGDLAPGQQAESPKSFAAGLRSYFVGLALAVALTVVSFWAAQTHLIYAPGVSVALITLAIAQMGIHLVFFLHLTTSPDNTNNALALAFGTLIVFLVVGGSLWITSNMSRMMPMPQQMNMP